MTAINKQPTRHEIEELLPWYAAGTLSAREAERVEQALAGDRELAQRYELVLRELVETTRLNEALGAPSARAMEKLFAAINAEEARAPRRRRRPISRTQFPASTRDNALDRIAFHPRQPWSDCRISNWRGSVRSLSYLRERSCLCALFTFSHHPVAAANIQPLLARRQFRCLSRQDHHRWYSENSCGICQSSECRCCQNCRNCGGVFQFP
jgi:Putative zinc-finger